MSASPNPSSDDPGCPEQVLRGGDWGRYERCGKPVKRDGLCGVHASELERRQAKDAARALEVQRLRDEHTDLLGAASRLSEYGIRADARYGNGLVLSAEATAVLLDLLDGLT